MLAELPEPTRQSEYTRGVNTCKSLGSKAKQRGEPLWVKSVYMSALNTIASHRSRHTAQRDANQADFELLKKYPDTENKAPEIMRVIGELEREIGKW